jgi:hypothetical protein
MKVQNMTSSRGNKIANQFIITDETNEMSGNSVEYFQSHDTIIAKRDKFRAGIEKRQVWLDANKWDYSVTTGKYRNIFLGETKKVTEKKIKSGEYLLTNLN